MKQDGRGYLPAQYGYEEPMPRGLAFGSVVPVVNEEALETEGAVGWLLVKHRRCGLVVIAVYRDKAHWSREMLAVWFGVSRTTLYRTLDEAHWRLLNYLNDRATNKARPQTALIQPYEPRGV